MNTQLDIFSTTKPAPIQRTVRVHFDGGAKGSGCEPGTGWGYGSYQIDRNPVCRVDHGSVMTANAAETLTLIKALKSVAASHNAQSTRVLIEGDSTIVINKVRYMANGGKKIKLRGSERFTEALQELAEIVRLFAVVEATWKSREHAVRAFGH